MSKLKILSAALSELQTIESVINSSKHESINSDNVLSFEMYLTLIIKAGLTTAILSALAVTTTT
jgi:hypothetical protein